jgi:hypothetical protein
LLQPAGCPAVLQLDGLHEYKLEQLDGLLFHMSTSWDLDHVQLINCCEHPTFLCAFLSTLFDN